MKLGVSKLSVITLRKVCDGLGAVVHVGSVKKEKEKEKGNEDRPWQREHMWEGIWAVGPCSGSDASVV